MNPRLKRAVALAAICAAALPTPVRADELGTALYVRSDSDDTTVVAPRIRAKTQIAEATSASLVYAVDVWTSASIDIVTSASTRPVTEQRDEIDASVDHEFPDVVLTAAYRYSVEPDYVSHGGSGGFSYEFAQNNATLALGFSSSFDKVGRAGDPSFSRDSTTLGTRVSFTQVLDVDTVVQGLYELSSVTGYLSSAYRYVAIGGEWGCASQAPLCVPEVNPGERLRHALALTGRRSLGERLSAGGTYRFYLDDWGVLSHTLRADLAYQAGDDTILTGRYRFYVQGAADHYKPFYLQVEPYVTSDKELSSLSSHRLSLEVEHRIQFSAGRELTSTLSIAPLLYTYSDFPPLDRITGLEINASLTLVL